jgi:hypothetical protein
VPSSYGGVQSKNGCFTKSLSVLVVPALDKASQVSRENIV